MTPEEPKMRSFTIDLDACSADDLSRLIALAAAPRTLDELLNIRAIDIVVARLLTDLAQSDRDVGTSLLHSVTEPGATLDSLRQLKDLAKRLVVRAKLPEHQTAATFLYHAANAAALARHGVDISSIPLAERLPLYAAFALAFRLHPLGALFEAAAQRDQS